MIHIEAPVDFSTDMVEWQNTYQRFKDNLIEQDDCWVPIEEDIQAFKARRSMQVVALKLRYSSSLVISSRNKIITLCNNPDCCNPEHLQIVPKASNVHDMLMSEIMSCENSIEIWEQFRNQVQQAEFRRNQLLSVADITPRKAALLNRAGYSYIWAALHYLFHSDSDIFEAFIAYLGARELLSVYNNLATVDKELCITLLKGPWAQFTSKYFASVLVCVTLLNANPESRQILVEKGVYVECQDAELL